LSRIRKWSLAFEFDYIAISKFLIANTEVIKRNYKEPVNYKDNFINRTELSLDLIVRIDWGIEGFVN